MSSQETLFEKMGVKYEKKGDFLYPKLEMGDFEKSMKVGKYGHIWIRLLYEEDPYKYRKMYLSGELYEEADRLNMEAYDYLREFEASYLKRYGIDASHTTESYQCRLMTVDICDEVITGYMLEKISCDKKIRFEKAKQIILEESMEE